MVLGSILLYSCELLTDLNGVRPVDIKIEVTESIAGNNDELPVIESLNFKIFNMSLGDSISSIYYITPVHNTFSFTSNDRIKYFYKDNVPQERFKDLNLKLGNTSPDTAESGYLMKGYYQGAAFIIELPDTLKFTFDFKPQFDLNVHSESTASIHIELNQSEWFVDKRKQIIDPTLTKNKEQIITNIINSFNVTYSITCAEGAGPDCKERNGKADMRNDKGNNGDDKGNNGGYRGGSDNGKI